MAVGEGKSLGSESLRQRQGKVIPIKLAIRTDFLSIASVVVPVDSQPRVGWPLP